MSGRLSPSRADFLRMLIIYEPSILANVKILNGRSEEKPKKVDILEDGRVFLYYGSGPKWLQRFFNSYGQVSLMDIAIKSASVMSGSGEVKNEDAFFSMMKVILKEAENNNDLDCVVDILFDNLRCSLNGELHSKYINEKYLQQHAKEVKQTGKQHTSTTGERCFVGIRTDDGRILPCYLGKTINL